MKTIIAILGIISVTSAMAGGWSTIEVTPDLS